MVTTITSTLRPDHATKRTLGKQRGGKRPGAGRPSNGSAHAKLTAKALDRSDARFARQELIASIHGTDRDPLLVLLEIACDRDKADELRIQAAAVAVRHVHPTLQQSQLAVVHQKQDQGRVLELLHDRLDRLAPPALSSPTNNAEGPQEPSEAPHEAIAEEAA